MSEFLDRLQPLALLVMRLVLATVMIAHGSQKVFGGMPKFQTIVSHIGFPAWMAYLSAAAEFGGGILVLLGVLTRLAALAITIDLLVAIVKVHAKAGLRGPGGFEFPLSVVVIAFALIFFGAGPISLDSIFSGRPSLPRRRG
ncbi:MAG: DoxX family protein [Acidobacteriia bacterium]|nr:DoxX family protein [Terriglobia bacterium]